MTAAGAARIAALVALLVSGGLLLAVLAATTPWRPLPGPRIPVNVHADFSLAEIAREDAFHRAVRPPAYASLGVALVAAGVLALTPGGARLVQLVARPLGGGWVWQAVLGGLAVALVARLAALPFDARVEVVLRRYGLSTQTWPEWFGDQARGLAVAVVLIPIVLVGFFALARAFPTRWWLPVGVGAAALTVLLSFVYPVTVEPLFNRFSSLPAGESRTSLLDLARRDGVQVDDVLVADASRRTTSLNAYVSGFGRTRRIVVYDTLLPASADEVRLIVAHDLGHVKRHDVLHSTVKGALGAVTASTVVFLLLTWPPLLRRAGVASAGDPRSLALLLFLFAVLSFLTAPALNLISRRIEARADVHAVDLTRDPATFIASERRLARTNLADLNPHPLVYGLFADHPTPPERIALARSWALQHGVQLRAAEPAAAGP